MKTKYHKPLYPLATLISLFAMPLWVNLGSTAFGEIHDKLAKFLFPGSPRLFDIIWVVVAFLLLAVYLYASKEPEQNENVTFLFARERLLKQLSLSWKNRLKKKMDDDPRLAIGFELSYSTVEANPRVVNEYLKEDLAVKKIYSDEDLFAQFVQDFKRLAIIGEPGAGKTVLMLRLAIYLAECALKDENFPVPLVLDISTWAWSSSEEEPPFETWLRKAGIQMAAELGLPQDTVEKLITSGKIIPVLDGFDEMLVARGYAKTSYQSIYNYADHVRSKNYADQVRSNKQKYPELAISCRTNDFHYSLKTDSGDIPVEAIVRIEPVRNLRAELGEIQKNDHKGMAWKLSNAIDLHPEILQVLDTSFSIHVALKLADDSDVFAGINSKEDLLDRYLKKQLGKLQPKYPGKDLCEYVSWIATNIRYEKFNTFDLKPQKKQSYWFYKCRDLIAKSPLLILAFYCTLKMAQNIHINFWSWKFVCMLVLVSGLLPGTYPDHLELENKIDLNKLKISTMNAIPFLTITFVAVWFIGYTNVWQYLVAGILLLLTLGLNNERELSSGYIRSLNEAWLSFYWRCLFKLGVFYSALGLIIMFFERIAGKVSLPNWSTPLAYPVIPCLFVLMTIRCLYDSFKSSALISNFFDRLILVSSGALPFQTDRFLRDLASVNILDEDGVEYRFKHLLIRRWFYQKAAPPDPDDLRLTMIDGELNGVADDERGI